jgi:hemin uptake protein HemP
MYQHSAPRPSAPPKEAKREPPGAPRRVFSTELFGQNKRILIEHGGADYELRITRQGKLILTK